MRKNLRSSKGAILIGLSLLGAIVMTIIRIKFEEFQLSELAAGASISAEEVRKAQEFGLSKVYDDQIMVKYLADAPGVLFALLMITLWLCPLVVTVLGFDSISADLQHRAVRYWSVRARRASYFTGKVVGLWGVVASLTLVMHLLIWVVSIVKGGVAFASASDTLKWGVHFYLTTLPVSAAWCALGVLLSSQFRSPIVAILVTCAAFAGLFLVNIVGHLWHLHALLYIYPSWYDALLLSPRLEHVAMGVAGCFAIAAIATAVGSFILTRSDV